MLNKKVTEKVKKLLDLANSDNQHEAELAAKMANDIMTKHNLAMGDLNADDYCKDAFFSATRKPVEAKFVMNILTRCFFVCTHYHVKRAAGKRTVTGTVFGEATNVQTALYVGAYLMRSMPKLWNQYKKANQAPANAKQAFYLGFTKGLIEQLEAGQQEIVRKESEKTGQALVLQDDPALAAYIANLNASPERRARIHGNAEAEKRGKEVGNKFRISRGIGAADGNQGRLIG